MRRRSGWDGASRPRVSRVWGSWPKEFKQFIGSDMRCSQVEFEPKPDSTHILGFYMGRNTPERREYIMENLVVPVED